MLAGRGSHIRLPTQLGPLRRILPVLPQKGWTTGRQRAWAEMSEGTITDLIPPEKR